MDERPTLVRDRRTGEVFEERVFGGNSLHFLYGTRRGRALTEAILIRRWFNVFYGWLQRGPWTRRRIQAFVDALGIDAGEATKPLSEYRSLDEFFTRRLRPEVRPIDPDPKHLLSPADGRVLAIPTVDGTLRIKEAEVGLAELLGDEALAEAYQGGPAVVVRLAPADYHWFHFPASGVAGPSRSLPGKLHSVHAIALAAGAPSFVNLRTVSTLSTEVFGDLVMVEVGAMLVGTIVQEYDPGPVERGEVKGYFRFGGSTVVVLAPPGRIELDEDLVADSADGLETLVHVGTRIGAAG